MARGAPGPHNRCAHARQTPQTRRSTPGAVGHRRDLVRITPSATPSIPRVHDLQRVPGPIRLSRPHRQVKAQVLGLNAAQLFRLDVHATRCALASDPLTGAGPPPHTYATNSNSPRRPDQTAQPADAKCSNGSPRRRRLGHLSEPSPATSSVPYEPAATIKTDGA